MSKQIVITAGPVYGKLDDNKLVSNRSRGLWATSLAYHLVELGHHVAMIVPDIMEQEFLRRIPDEYIHDPKTGRGVLVLPHEGYDDYRKMCNRLAPEADTMIMAAAVLNWIPETPFPGKMPTDKHRMDIPFILAARVISEMKAKNPLMTLIGCKLLFSGDVDTLVNAAYHVLLQSRCNAVIANDAKLGLKKKFVVHQDRSVATFDNDFNGLYKHITAIIDDVHYRTEKLHLSCNLNLKSSRVFTAIVEKRRTWFTRRVADSDFVFGAVAVRNFHPDEKNYFYTTPREKGEMFGVDDAVEVRIDRETRTVFTSGGKATLNAPLLIRHLQKFPQAAGVLHYHGEPPKQGEAPIAPYAPPGTARDNEREIPALHYFIEGHGWIIAVDEDGEPLV